MVHVLSAALNIFSLWAGLSPLYTWMVTNVSSWQNLSADLHACILIVANSVVGYEVDQYKEVFQYMVQSKCKQAHVM